MMDITWAQLHKPLFLNGRNFGDKLESKLTSGLSMKYDRDNKELVVFYGGKSIILPYTSVFSMIEAPEVLVLKGKK